MIFKRRFSQIERRLPQIFSVLLLFLSLARCAYADIAAVTVSPVTKTIDLSKGESRSVVFIVYNNSDQPQLVSVRPRYWYMLPENEGIPLDSWLKIIPDEFEIGPKEKKEVKAEVSVPSEAIGELAAMIAFRPAPKEGQAINVVFSVSLYVRIKDTWSIDCKINDFRLQKLEDRNALSIEVVLHNEGNIHLKPNIKVFVQNLFGRTLGKAGLQYGRPTYPGRSQAYSGAVYNFKLRPGLYKTMVDMEFTNVATRFRKNVYFLVGKDGKVIFTFLRRPKQE